MREKPLMNGPQMPGGTTDPIGERRTIKHDPLPRVDLRLPIQRQVIGVFGDQHMRDGCFGRQAAFNQTRRRGGLRDRALASATGVFWTARHQHAEMRRHDVEPLGDILANLMQQPFAARTGFVVDINDNFDARQMSGQSAAIDAAFPRRLLTLGRGFGFRLRRRAGFRLLDLFEREQHLVFGQRFRATTKTMALQLLDDLNEPLVANALGDEHRLQLVRIVGKHLDRRGHGRRKSYFPWLRDDFRRPDSLCRSLPRQRRRWRFFARVNAAPIETFEQRGKLRRRQPHRPILDLGPAELTVFEPLVPHMRMQPPQAQLSS